MDELYSPQPFIPNWYQNYNDLDDEINNESTKLLTKLINYYSHINDSDLETINSLKQKRRSRIEQERKRQEALMKQNEINMHSAAWGSSLPGLLIAFGLPGLLAGGAIYGGIKLYDRYNKNKNSESEFDVGWLDEPYRLVQQDSVGTIL